MVFSVPDEEEETYECDFEDVDAGEELREGVVEEEAVGVDFVALHVVVVVTVGEPEEGECAGDEEEH